MGFTTRQAQLTLFITYSVVLPIMAFFMAPRPRLAAEQKADQEGFNYLSRFSHEQGKGSVLAPWMLKAKEELIYSSNMLGLRFLLQ
jgi:hypothetical protein